MNKKAIILIHILCPIAAGALVYYLISPDVIFIKKTENLIGGTHSMHVFPADSTFLRLVRNYLPDMMWGYSLVFALFYIIGNNAADIWKVFWLAFPFSAGIEMMQKTSFIPGTFDVFDIFVEFLAETIAVCIICKFYSKEDFFNEKKQEIDCRNIMPGYVYGNGIGQRSVKCGRNQTGCLEPKNRNGKCRRERS